MQKTIVPIIVWFGFDPFRPVHNHRSLRPVAVGESLRRLCSKVAVELMGSSVRSILEPTQVGVQTKAGCEARIHTTRQWTTTFCDDPDGVLVLVDLSNAFNCVSRGAVLSAVRRHFPWMTPWAGTCYRHDSNLLVGSPRIRCRRGVQQADLLGPSLFAPVVHPGVIEAIRVSEAQYLGQCKLESRLQSCFFLFLLIWRF